MSEAKDLDTEEKRALADKYFEYWWNKASGFSRQFKHAMNDQDFNIAAFNLHQVTEAYFNTILLVFTFYSPKSHDVERLYDLTKGFHLKLPKIFPQKTDKEKQLFDLLKRSYVDARYSPTFEITKKELNWLASRIDKLKKLTYSICTAKIEKI